MAEQGRVPRALARLRRAQARLSRRNGRCPAHVGAGLAVSERSRRCPFEDKRTRSSDGEVIHRSQAHSQALRAHFRGRPDAEPDRGAEELLRPVPAEGRGAGAAPHLRAPGGLQVGLPDQGFLGARPARVRQVRARGAEVRRRGVPAARHDLRRPPQGDAAPRGLGRRRGDRLALHPRHQGAGRLHGRHAAHDGERHLHHQRHRARHRQPDAPLARRLLRPRQGQDATARASISSPRASSPTAAPGSISSSTPRTSSTCASTAGASCR